MNKVRKITPLVLLLALWMGCATHPSISPEITPVDEINWGYTFSVENTIPMIWFRRGLSEKSDLGLRIGFPFYGTGMDYTQIVMQKDNKWDAINLSFAINPNSNFDFTYYKFKRKIKKSKDASKPEKVKVRWKGFRFMYIPQNEIRGNSFRFGFLMGRKTKQGFGYEIGYFHDFASMPISKILSFKWDNQSAEVKNDWGRTYDNYPHSRGGWPSEYARGTGLSFQLMYYLGDFDLKNIFPK